jgi:hypothetical protein
MRPLPCVAICRNATTRRAARTLASLSPLPRLCGAGWAALGQQTAEMSHAPQRISRSRTMLLSSISSLGSPTTRPSLLSRMCNATARGLSWVVTVCGTTSTHASTLMQIGPAHTSMFCGCWSTSVMPLVLTPITRGCFFLSNKQADNYFAALGYQTHKEEFCHHHGVFFQRN